MGAVRQPESTMWTNTFLFIDINNLNHYYKLSLDENEISMKYILNVSKAIFLFI